MAEGGGGGGGRRGREREYSKGRRETWRRGRREGKGREPRGGEGRGTELSLLKVVPGRWERQRSKGGGGRVDYLRLIWIVDYSGPRGAAWPRVSISEPLARAHLRLPLLLCCLRSSRTRPALPNLSQASTRAFSLSLSLAASLSSSSLHRPTLPDRLLSPPTSRFLLAERSSSVPTRRLGLRPITCLPVIRCCANLPSSHLPRRLVSHANSLCVRQDSKPGESPSGGGNSQ